MAGHVLDPVQLRLLVRIRGLLPGAGALEADVMLAQDQAQPFAPDNDAPVVAVGAQIGGELSARSSA